MEKGRKLLRVGIPALLAACVLAAGAGSGVWAALRAPSVDALRIDAAARLKKTPEMPPAVFRHDRHTEALAAQGKDCTACHEAPQAGRAFVFRATGGKADAEELERLYHEGCIGCHADSQTPRSAPQDGQCRLCHDAGARFADDADQPRPRMGKALHARHAASEALQPDFAVPEDKGRNCGVCHHVWDPERKALIRAPGKEDNCAACHTAAAEGDRPALKDAVHAACVGCHADAALKSRIAAAGESRQAGGEASTSLPSAPSGLGPETCAGCHGPGAPAPSAEGPRLMRGQPDATVLLPTQTPGLTSPDAPAASMPPVLFDHKAHEAVTDSCRTCHHVRIENCSVCHTVPGSKDGNFVSLSSAMHNPDSERSCVGCHRERVETRRECAGCHGGFSPAANKETCAGCHREVQGLSPAAVGDGPAPDRGERERLARENLPVASVPPLPASEVPETVSIGTLSDHFEPAVMPHRKIYEALLKGMGNDALAAAFHAAPTTACAACHHNSPAESLRHPPRCASCHGAQADKKPVRDAAPSLKAAYHQQCMACHERMAVKPAPTDCAACHVERKAAEGQL